MKKVILYTTHCPRCEILSKKLNQKNIPYEEVTDMNIMLEKRFAATPILEVDGQIMNFSEANKWINTF